MRRKFLIFVAISLTLLCLTVAVQANTMTNFYGSWDFRFFYHLSSRMADDLWNERAGEGVELGDGMVTATMADTSLLVTSVPDEAVGTVPNGAAPIGEIDTPPPTSVPEPSTSLLLATGTASLAVAWFGRKDH